MNLGTEYLRKKKQAAKIVGLTFLMLSLMLFNGCGREKVITKTDFVLDTVSTVTIYGSDDEALLTDSFQFIRDWEKRLSAYREESEISMINAAAGKEAVAVSPETFALLERCQTFSEESGGVFDVTVGPLVDLWDIAHGGEKIPTEAEITAARSLVDYHKLILDEKNQTAYLSEPGMKINLGGVAKGFIADELKAFLLDKGVTSAVLNLGGNVLLIGEKPGDEAFNVGVENPNDQSQSLGILALRDTAAVTSGDYQRYFLGADGRRYHHILDPRTGYPADSGLRAVTIVCDNSADADALSTSLFVLGEEAGLKLLSEKEEALFVSEDGGVTTTSELAPDFTFDEGTADFSYHP